MGAGASFEEKIERIIMVKEMSLKRLKNLGVTIPPTHPPTPRALNSAITVSARTYISIYLFTLSGQSVRDFLSEPTQRVSTQTVYKKSSDDHDHNKLVVEELA